MILPVVLVRYLPDERCVGCGQAGYCDDKFFLCAGCHNISLAIFSKGKRRRKEKELAKVLSEQLRKEEWLSIREVVQTVSKFLRGVRVLEPEAEKALRMGTK
jgi:hypothetical protein